jgi:hypothetical protein
MMGNGLLPCEGDTRETSGYVLRSHQQIRFSEFHA